MGTDPNGKFWWIIGIAVVLVLSSCSSPSSSPSDYYATDSEDINCYAYAMGDYKNWLHPGKGIKDMKSVDPSERSMPDSYTVEDVQGWVKDDFGDRVRLLSSKDDAISDNEYRVAMRVQEENGSTKDCHFWRQLSDGSWAMKQSWTPSTWLGFVDPDDDTKWGRYNSTTLYIAVKKG